MFAGPEGPRLFGGDGIGLPVLRSLSTPDVLAGVRYEWEDPGTYLKSVERARIQVAPAYQEVSAVFQRELRLCFEGQKSVKDAAEAMKREVDPLLKQFGRAGLGLSRDAGAAPDSRRTSPKTASDGIVPPSAAQEAQRMTGGAGRPTAAAADGPTGNPRPVADGPCITHLEAIPLRVPYRVPWANLHTTPAGAKREWLDAVVLRLRAGDLEVTGEVPGGPEAAEGLVARVAPTLRGASPLTIGHALGRLTEALGAGRAASRRDRAEDRRV